MPPIRRFVLDFVRVTNYCIVLYCIVLYCIRGGFWKRASNDSGVVENGNFQCFRRYIFVRL